jgi:bacillithiol biosynthesis cysteine-adding enzyme BshC
VATGIFDAFLRGEAGELFGAHPTHPLDRRAAVERAARPLAPTVADALAAQNAGLAPSPARDAHLQDLRRGAAAVVTGQQVGLFLGPLYTLYKAATAIAVARALAAETGRPVVPVFWLQTEDHDLPEIAACHVSCAGGESLDLALPAPPGDRISIAHRTLPPDVEGCLEALRAALAHLPHGEAHVARLARHYRPGAGWARAFAGVLAELFAAEGLVLIDPRDPALGSDAEPVHRQAILRAAPIAEALASRVAAIEAAGFEAPVHVRRGAPLSFFHPRGASGPRYRLEPADGGFAEVGGSGTHSPSALLAALAADPLAFSTSALLRPILQDTLLPTAAYVGGPGEVAYFAQLGPLYAEYGLPMPVVVPRARFRVVDEGTRRLLDRLRLDPDDTLAPEDALLARCQAPERDLPRPAQLAQALVEPFDQALAHLAPRLAAVGQGLDAAMERTRGAVQTAVSKLAAKYEKASLHRDQKLVDDVRRLKRLLYPGDAPQERFYGLPSFAARFGEREFVHAVLAAVRPFEFAPRDLP